MPLPLLKLTAAPPLLDLRRRRCWRAGVPSLPLPWTPPRLIFINPLKLVFLLLVVFVVAAVSALLFSAAMAFLLVPPLPPIVVIMGGRCLGQPLSLPPTFIQWALPFILLMGGRSPLLGGSPIILILGGSPIIFILGGLHCIALGLLLSLTPSYRRT